MRDTLEAEGWSVEVCADGDAALERIAGDAHYDLLLLDNDLPGVDGLELARYARRLPARERTPIVMLAAAGTREDARRAGVDAFLRKPEDVRLLVETIKRLLAGARAPE